MPENNILHMIVPLTLQKENNISDMCTEGFRDNQPNTSAIITIIILERKLNQQRKKYYQYKIGNFTLHNI